MATSKELSDFLISVERRAFKQTAFAVRDDHAAMDIVQDAMMKLAEKYGEKPAEEYPMLFQRILQNTMRDYWRRQKVRNLWTTLFSSFTGHDGEDNEYNVLESLTNSDLREANEPETTLEKSQTLVLIEEAVKKLPTRQREAFVLRYWVELDVAETAASMGCSEGSVKTHCSRAVAALSMQLKGFNLQLNR
jgi:RNA polymerase sigma-70 factor (ECF subfamily)